MRKHTKMLLVLLLALVCLFAFAACSDSRQPADPTGSNSAQPADPTGGAGSTTAPIASGNGGGNGETEHTHEYGEWIIVTEATCTENGLQERTCECGEYETRNIDALGHTEVTDEAVEATCTETGLTEGKHCSVCGEILVKQEVVPATGHSYATVITAPTCTKQGYTTHTCKNCGDSYKDDYVNATGHNYVDYVCANCGSKASKGLDYTLNSDGESYSVTGIGTCTDTDLVIPSTYNDLPVTSIGKSAFSGCTGLTSITIPDSVTSIGRSAFYNCTGLTNVTIGNGVTSIGGHAFQECTSLTSITIPDSVTSIGNSAFVYCTRLKSITIPDSVTSIGYCAFADCCNLAEIQFEGTTEQWEAITFGSSWDSSTGEYTIHCSDGDITK